MAVGSMCFSGTQKAYLYLYKIPDCAEKVFVKIKHNRCFHKLQPSGEASEVVS